MPLRILVALVAGLGLSLAFEPVAFAWIQPVAVAGLVLSTRGLRIRGGLLVGLVFGLTFYLVLTYWMSPSIGPDAWIGMSAFESLFYALLGGVSAHLQRHRLWPVWVAAAWTVLDLLRSTWPFSGMPWGRLAFAAIDTPVAPALPYVGVTLLSFALALLGCLLAWALTARQRRRGAALGALVVTGAALVVPALLPWTPDVTDEVTVAAVQGDVPGPGNDILYDYRQVTQNQVDATRDLAARVESGQVPRPAFVVWPENSTAVDPFDDFSTSTQIRAGVAAIGVPVLVGAVVDAGPGHVLNQGIVWDPVTGAGDRYTKWHPVVFGEFIPYRGLVKHFDVGGRLQEVGRDMLAGTRREPLEIAGIKVADAICFDVAYDDGIDAQIRRGAQLVTVQTSNATFIFTDQIEQQFAITRLRALETGRWVVVSSTNGISGIIAPDGRVTTTADPRTQAVLTEQVGLIDGLTPATRIGPWAGRALVLVTLLGLVVAGVPYRRRMYSHGLDPSLGTARPVAPTGSRR